MQLESKNYRESKYMSKDTPSIPKSKAPLTFFVQIKEANY